MVVQSEPSELTCPHCGDPVPIVARREFRFAILYGGACARCKLQFEEKREIRPAGVLKARQGESENSWERLRAEARGERIHAVARLVH